ncbi:MAG: NADP-dependent isocitrate dehydrogenase [Planctomycetota bacterium]
MTPQTTPTDAPEAAIRTPGEPVPIAVAHGDGIGPAIMDATLRILEAARVPIAPERIEIGEKVYLSGVTSGIEERAWDVLRRTRVFLKAPITTPQGGGYKSLNVTTRKTLGLYANVRPCRSFHPFVQSRHPGMDVAIIRENEEDTYAGIEHRQTAEATQCLKLITRPGSERIVRYAFDYAERHGRRRVTCMVKDNIMKITDGLFRRCFEEEAARHPDIEADVMIIDIGTARIADAPETFDVVVLPNLYGDIVSDVVAQLAGSVGIAGSANIGDDFAMFEAIHGSAPDIAGKGIANPSALLQGSLMMLVHLGLTDHANLIQNAWLKTLEDGVVTGDLVDSKGRRGEAGTDAFTDAVIERLGDEPRTLPHAAFRAVTHEASAAPAPVARPNKELRGVDVFLDWSEDDRDANVIGERIAAAGNDALRLLLVTNRGVKVWPDGFPETFCSDHWRCRFVHPDGGTVARADVIALLSRIEAAGLDFIKTEHLYSFDGEKGWSLAQGE